MDLPLLVTNPTNIRYLTGFVGASPKEREAYCLVMKSQIYLITNPLYTEYARNLVVQSRRGSNKPINQLSNKQINKELRKLISRLGIKKLGFEENDLTISEYNEILKQVQDDESRIALVPTKGRVEEPRMIKREDEIENIRAAAKLADQCLDFILGKLKPGVTEREIAWEIELFLRRTGSDLKKPRGEVQPATLAFSPIVAFGKHTSQPHYQPSDVSLQRSDIILLDFGARVNGYCSDMTRVVFVGHPDEEWQRAYHVVLRAQKSALDTILRCIDTSKRTNKSINISGTLLDRTARKEIIQMGFPPYPHSLGHGVGLGIHEAPRLTINKNVTLKPNMIVTIEPAIYVEGTYGIRIEDLVLLKSDGIEILSQSPKTLTIL